MTAVSRRLFAALHPAWPAVAAGALLAGLGALAAIVQAGALGHVLALAWAGRAAAVLDGFALHLLAAAILARALCAGLGELAAQRLATRVKAQWRHTLIARLMDRTPIALAHERTGELVTTAVDGVEALDAYYRRFVPQLLTLAVVPPIVLAAVAWRDPASALVLGITAPLIPIFMWLLGTLARERAQRQWRSLARLGGAFLDTMQGLPTLVRFGRTREAADALGGSSDALRRTTMDVLRVAFLSGLVLELAATVATALVAVGLGVRLIEGWIALEGALIVLLLTPEFYLPFRQLGQRHHAAMEGEAAAERLVALVDAAPAVPEHALHRHPASSRAPDRPPRITFEGVTVRYPGDRDGVAGTLALEEVDLVLEPGAVTAIVGPTGAGKSTVLAVLLRFVEPSAGRVAVDGLDLTRIDRAAWRGALAVVPQRPSFFAGSILDNLRLGRPAASLAQVREAARLAQVDTAIAGLSRGYDTAITEAAGHLSGGERQRLALARALVTPRPVLLLDEPTSALDEATEAAVADAIEAIAPRRTIVLMAHRLATVRRAARVVLLEGGRVRAVGRPEALLGEDDRLATAGIPAGGRP